MNSFEDGVVYHEIDFLLPSQRLNINFSYVTKRGLPFVREYILRLVHLAPMTKAQIASFFGFSRREADEAVMDLVGRGELTLSDGDRLTLTEKSIGYFTDVGEVPRLSLLRDSGAFLAFDLATYTCIGRDIPNEKWRMGVSISVDERDAANSQTLVEKSFQRQFNEILQRGFLSRSIVEEEGEYPSIYTVNSVHKVRQLPWRIPIKFKVDGSGGSLELEDIEGLKSSDYVHEQIALELNRMSRPRNFLELVRAMNELGDLDTIKVFDTRTEVLNPHFLSDLLRLEANEGRRSTFVGPIYSQENWTMLQRYLAPVLDSRMRSKADPDPRELIWLAPSDPCWGKSLRLQTALSDLASRAMAKDRRLYSPLLYLPLASKDDVRSVRSWRQEIDQFASLAHGLLEGFLGGSVEILLFEGEVAVVVYHISMPDLYRATVPVGFISADKAFVGAIGKAVRAYLDGSAGYDAPNDCGPILELARPSSRRASPSR